MGDSGMMIRSLSLVSFFFSPSLWVLLLVLVSFLPFSCSYRILHVLSPLSLSRAFLFFTFLLCCDILLPYGLPSLYTSRRSPSFLLVSFDASRFCFRSFVLLSTFRSFLIFSASNNLWFICPCIDRPQNVVQVVEGCLEKSEDEWGKRMKGEWTWNERLDS